MCISHNALAVMQVRTINVQQFTGKVKVRVVASMAELTTASTCAQKYIEGQNKLRTSRLERSEMKQPTTRNGGKKGGEDRAKEENEEKEVGKEEDPEEEGGRGKKRKRRRKRRRRQVAKCARGRPIPTA
jgi:hypothetical protein